MTRPKPETRIEKELQEGMNLAKCRKCGCMKDFLETANQYFSTHHPTSDLHKNIINWQIRILPTEYSCLGCKYCFPAVAENVFHKEYTEADINQTLCIETIENSELWPPITGEYFVLCNGRNCEVAISTLASVELAEKLATLKPDQLCIVGKTETENIGIDKIIKNTISNKAIKHLILAGKESEGHKTGETLLALIRNGVDKNNRIIGSSANRPVLQNVTPIEIQSFREQVNVIDLIGCEDENVIVKKINEFGKPIIKPCSCKDCNETEKTNISIPKIVKAKEPTKIELDKMGYYVVYPQKTGEVIVEHYENNNKLLRIIKGHNTREIYWTIIENGWVTQLSHAAYLGKELTKAELSMKYGFKYIQDKA